MAKRKSSDTVDIKIRMKEPVRRKIEQAAAKRGVSMNAEMVSRLEQSFTSEDYMALVFGDSTAGRFVRSLLDAKKIIEGYTQKSVWEDLEAHTAMRAAADEIFLGHQPDTTIDLAERRLKHRDLFKSLEKKGGSPPDDPGLGPIKKAEILGRSAADFIRKGYKNELQKLAEVRAAEAATVPSRFEDS
ncbi:MAG: Arc family DNA-binding protein [Rhodospirillales bacterium]|jgi:hypothetical protein|nr:Arc family DNA-binding protein [Rhodospirillales bacterium]MDP7216000.1 Arc family DNA-binding protein [Rhodospirillales bacterium]HIJ43034.1 Arc family DNA-binding protein [Rhodospirillaceae bacterium]HIJ92694.1 Arc family DNA-binding protein [Rhodospirillaceae bacterium]